MNIVLLGAPGSGKGTQAERLHRSIGVVHVATGDLFRKHLKNETQLGRLAKTYMDRGELVPDAVTIDMLRARLSESDVGEGVLFDGFPRNLQQAVALDGLLEDLGQHLNGVIYVRVADESLVERLSGRLICRECQVPFHKTFNPFRACPVGKCESGQFLYQRDDDQPATVSARLVTFHSLTAPLIEHYQSRRLLQEVDGVGTVDVVTERVEEAIGLLSQVD